MDIGIKSDIRISNNRLYLLVFDLSKRVIILVKVRKYEKINYVLLNWRKLVEFILSVILK